MDQQSLAPRLCTSDATKSEHRSTWRPRTLKRVVAQVGQRGSNKKRSCPPAPFPHPGVISPSSVTPAAVPTAAPRGHRCEAGPGGSRSGALARQGKAPPSPWVLARDPSTGKRRRGLHAARPPPPLQPQQRRRAAAKQAGARTAEGGGAGTVRADVMSSRSQLLAVTFSVR